MFHNNFNGLTHFVSIGIYYNKLHLSLKYNDNGVNLQLNYGNKYYMNFLSSKLKLC